MPRYDYYCALNRRTVEVTHSIKLKLSSWGEVCEYAGIELGELAYETRVERIITIAPMANTPMGNAGLKNLGFTKLVKRDVGVYENMTRTGTEKRYMRNGDPSSQPHLDKKIRD